MKAFSTAHKLAIAAVEIAPFYDAASGTVTYVVSDPDSGEAAVIDTVLDFEPDSGRIASTGVHKLVDHLRERELWLRWILETHAHADHLSGAQALKHEMGGEIAIGEHILQVQQRFGKLFDMPPQTWEEGGGFDRLLADRECLALGNKEIEVLATPGHTPACVSYRIDDAVFVGDTLFMPDVGTARADFPGGDARQLYRSIHRLLALPAETRLFMCHDYGLESRAPAWQSTVAEERSSNPMVGEGISEEAFVSIRGRRDATLGAPARMLAALQVNICAGRLPPPAANGISYLKIPLNVLGGRHTIGRERSRAVA